MTVSSGGTFPYQGNDPKLLEAIKPTRFLQSDDKRIVELARQAVGDTKDAAASGPDRSSPSSRKLHRQ